MNIAGGLELDKNNNLTFQQVFEAPGKTKALVMTYAYSNATFDKIEEAVKNGIVGNEDEDW